MTLMLQQSTHARLSQATNDEVATAKKKIDRFQDDVTYKELYEKVACELEIEKMKYDVYERACRDQTVQMMSRHEEAMRAICTQRDRFDDSRKEMLKKNGRLEAILRGKEQTISGLLEVVDRIRGIANTMRFGSKGRQIREIVKPIPTESKDTTHVPA